MRVDPQKLEDYRQAYGAWQEQLGVLHRVFLEGEPLERS